MKSVLVLGYEGETGSQSIVLFDLSRESAHPVTILPLRMSANDCKSAACIHVGATNRFQLVGTLTNTESTNKTNCILY